jgi:type IV pilus assembly protein PilM
VINLGSLFGQSSPPLIGLDISTSGVRLVELSDAAKDGLTLERVAFEPLARGAVVDGNIDNIDAVAEAVRRVWAKSGTRIRHVALGMPPAAVISRKIVLPAGLPEDQLEVQVESEASQYIPFALDEVSLDFDVIGAVPNAPEDMEVMLAAARREKVEDRVAIAEAAGLVATVMDVESYAARAAAQRVIGHLRGEDEEHGGDGVAALFQFGTQATHISVLHGGETVYEQERPFGGVVLTQEIARAHGLPFEEAEARKKTGDLAEGWRDELLKPFLENAALEVTRAIQFFFTSTPYTRIDRIYLAGGAAMTPGLPETIAARTRIATGVISPFKGMRLAPTVREQHLRGDAPGYLVACGLALRRFDR